MVDLFQKNVFVELRQAEDFGTDAFQDFVVDDSFDRAGMVAPFFLFAAADPVFFVPSVSNRVHITAAAMWAFDFARKAAGVERLISKGAEVPPPFELSLDSLPFLHRDDGFVGVLHEILRQFAAVLL